MQLNNMVQHRVRDFRIVPAPKPMYQRRLLPFVLSKAAFDFPNCLIATVKCEKRLWWTHYKRMNHKLKVACWRFKWLNLQIHYNNTWFAVDLLLLPLQKPPGFFIPNWLPNSLEDRMIEVKDLFSRITAMGGQKASLQLSCRWMWMGCGGVQKNQKHI